MDLSNDPGFVIKGDGTIVRKHNELDHLLLSAIRESLGSDDILVAYKTRKRCYKLAKAAGLSDYKSHVNGLMQEYFPKEYLKADLGRTWLWYHFFFVICTVSLFTLILFPIPLYLRIRTGKEIRALK